MENSNQLKRQKTRIALELYKPKQDAWLQLYLVIDDSKRTILLVKLKAKNAYVQLDLTCLEINTNVQDPKPNQNANGTKCFELSIFGKTYLLRCPEQTYTQLIDKISQMKSKAETLFEDSEISDSETESVSSESIPKEPAGHSPPQDGVPPAPSVGPVTYIPGTNPFDILPDEAVIRVWSFLDAPNVGRAAKVCRRFKQISYDLPLWQELSTKKNWDMYKSSAQLMQMQAKPVTRSFYVRKYLSFQKKEKQIQDLQLQTYRNRLKEQDKANSASFMLFTCFARPYEWLAALSFLWLTIVTPLKLDGTLDWEWKNILIPFYIIILQFLTAPLLYDYMSTKFDYSFEEELDPDDNRCCGPIFFFLAFVLPLSEEKATGRAGLYPLSIGFSLFLMLAAMRVAGVHGLPWWAVCIPLCLALLWLGLLILYAGNAYQSVFEDDQRFDRLVPCAGICILIVFLMLMALRTDNYIDWSWYTVMVPLWTIKGLMVVLPIILSLLTIIFKCKGSYWLEDRTRWAGDAGPFCAASAAVAVLLLVPLLTFEILLAKKLEGDNDISYTLIFVPMFILEGFAICGCCIVNVAFLCS